MGIPADPLPINDVFTKNDLSESSRAELAKVEKAYEVGEDAFPYGSVSLNTFGNTHVSAGLTPSNDQITFKLGDNDKKVGVGGNAAFWLRPRNVKYGPGARIELMPARKSWTPSQGQQIPGAGAGLEIRTKSNIARLPIPGSRPIYQHMGIAEETINFVGAFCGFDIPEGLPEGGVIRSQLSYGKERLGDAWDEAMAVIEAVRAGYEIELVMRWNSDSDNDFADISLDYLPGTKYTGYIRNFVKEFATAQRVYYRVEMVITNRQSIVPDESSGVEAPSLAPTTITGGTAGKNLSAAQTQVNLASLKPNGPNGSFFSKDQLQNIANQNIQQSPIAVTNGKAGANAPVNGQYDVSTVGGRAENLAVVLQFKDGHNTKIDGRLVQEIRYIPTGNGSGVINYFGAIGALKPIGRDAMNEEQFKAAYPDAWNRYKQDYAKLRIKT